MNKAQILQFIRENSKPGDFWMDESGYVWAVGDSGFKCGPCPICWVATKLGKNPRGNQLAWKAVVEPMGAVFEDAQDIAWAADDLPQAECRKELLEACHLA